MENIPISKQQLVLVTKYPVIVWYQIMLVIICVFLMFVLHLKWRGGHTFYTPHDFFFLSLFILRIKREREAGRGRERGRERESQVGSMPRGEPNSGLDLTTLGST